VYRGARHAIAFALSGTMVVSPAIAVELNGSARLSASESDDDGIEVQSMQTTARLDLAQQLSPYLRLRFGGSYGEFASEVEGEEVSSRTTLRPEVALLYARPELSWQVHLLSHRIEDDSAAGELRSEAWRSNLTWRPGGGLQLQLAYRDESNSAENLSLGRDLRQRSGRVEVLYDRTHWGIGYVGWRNQLAATASGLEVEQIRHDLRLHGAREFADRRLRLSIHGQAGRLDSTARQGEATPAEPLAVVQGLFAIDLSPAISELEPAPGLVDGNTADPTDPAIEIGGANTYRNLGVELAFVRPASRLEVWVNRPSAPGLSWEVFWSADNLLWEPIAGVSSEYDSALQVYTLRFSAIQARFLKAVNVSSNSSSEVQVTEIRVLRDLGALAGADERATDLYRAGLSVGWSVTPRIDLFAGADIANDEATLGDVVRQDATSRSARASARVELPRGFELGASYRWSALDEAVPRALVRSSRDVSASLRWRPLPTVDAALVSAVRSDFEEDVELATNTSTRLSLGLQLLEELGLNTDLTHSRLEGERIGFARETWSWSQRLEMHPRERLRVAAGYNWSRTEPSAGTGPAIERSHGYGEFEWTPGSALSLRGTLFYEESAGRSALHQLYGLRWAPGPKLSLGLVGELDEESDGRLTSRDSLTVAYRLASRWLVTGSIARSHSELDGARSDEVTTANITTAVSF
jgi:hypothetical protein